jgi:hypothetical protein
MSEGLPFMSHSKNNTYFTIHRGHKMPVTNHSDGIDGQFRNHEENKTKFTVHRKPKAQSLIMKIPLYVPH